MLSSSEVSAWRVRIPVTIGSDFSLIVPLLSEDGRDLGLEIFSSHLIVFRALLNFIIWSMYRIYICRKIVTVLPFARMQKREPEELVGLPGFAGRMNRRGFVDLMWLFFIYRRIWYLFTMRGQRCLDILDLSAEIYMSLGQK